MRESIGRQEFSIRCQSPNNLIVIMNSSNHPFHSMFISRMELLSLYFYFEFSSCALQLKCRVGEDNFCSLSELLQSMFLLLKYIFIQCRSSTSETSEEHLKKRKMVSKTNEDNNKRLVLYEVGKNSQLRCRTPDNL